MSHRDEVPAGQHWRLMTVACNFNAAPTTSEDFTITWDNVSGAIFDLLLYTLDPSVGITTDILWQPDEEIILIPGDAILVQFANTDARNYGLQVTFKAV
jgi:hypothetical protein